MRKLTSKQKKLLDTWFNDYQPKTDDELKMRHWEQLVAINDTEILWQEINRYLYDKQMEKLYG